MNEMGKLIACVYVCAQVIQMVTRYPARMYTCTDFKSDWKTICGEDRPVLRGVVPWRTLPVCVGTKRQKHLDAEMVSVHTCSCSSPYVWFLCFCAFIVLLHVKMCITRFVCVCTTSRLCVYFRTTTTSATEQASFKVQLSVCPRVYL